MNACMTNAPPERRNHKRSAAPPHRSCGACRSRISRDARFCASSSNAAATREEAPRPPPPPPPGRTPVVCMMQTKKTWASFPFFPRASFQAPPSFFLSSSFFFLSFFFLSFFLLFFLKYSSAYGLLVELGPLPALPGLPRRLTPRDPCLPPPRPPVSFSDVGWVT